MANRPVHFEILGNDPAQLVRFYETVFEWKIQKWEGPEDYWMASTGDGAGIDGGFMRRELSQSVINTSSVESVEEMISRVERAGGKLLMGPHEIPGVGRHAYCTDPEGNIFGIIQELREA